MEVKNIFVKKSEIEVSVVKVGTKKLTKSLLEQISYWFPFDHEYAFKGNSIFGYAKLFHTFRGEQVENLIVVGEKNGKLFKFNLNEIAYIPQFRPDVLFRFIRNNYKLEQLCGGIEMINPKFLNEYEEFDNEIIPTDAKIKDIVTEEGLNNITKKVTNAKSFLDEIYKHQVYI